MDKSRLILRFRLNHGGSPTPIRGSDELAKRARQGVRVLIPEIALQHADKQYKFFAGRIKAQIEEDVNREIANIARHYNLLVIGAGPRLTGPSDRALRTAAEGGPESSVKGMGGVPPWPVRSEKYLAMKRQKGLSPNWFLGETQHMRNSMKSAGTWTEMFGPVQVTVSPRKGVVSEAPQLAQGPTSGSSQTRVRLAQIKVRALGEITPSMLQDFSARSSLMGKIASHDMALAYRVAGRSTHHRATLEPFLTFVLTKAIPYAVQQRINKGLGAKLSRSSDTQWFGSYGSGAHKR